MVFLILWPLWYVLAGILFVRKYFPLPFFPFLNIPINWCIFLKLSVNVINYMHFTFLCSRCPKFGQHALFMPGPVSFWHISISFWVVSCFLAQNVPGLPCTFSAQNWNQLFYSRILRDSKCILFCFSFQTFKKSSFCICCTQPINKHFNGSP